MLVLSYLGPFALIPFFLEQEDEEVKWHSRHGLVLMGAELVLWVGYLLVSTVLSAAFAPLGCLMTLLSVLIGFGLFVLHIACIMKALKGEKLLIPQLSDFADKF